MDKLKDLAKMFCESDYSANSMFGDILYNTLISFEARLREVQYHIGQSIGNICIVQSNIMCRVLPVGTVIDAGYWDKAKRIMVTDKVKENISREIGGGAK
ncbi:MAG: hypothetical protein HQK63_12995 [Desulfamplus sp.]|nr:hypothetical protein [Desulfamplus sp.]